MEQISRIKEVEIDQIPFVLVGYLHSSHLVFCFLPPYIPPPRLTSHLPTYIPTAMFLAPSFLHSFLRSFLCSFVLSLLRLRISLPLLGEDELINLRNKCDLVADRKVAREEAIDFAEKNGLVYLEGSAKKRLNVEEMFRIVSLRVLITVYERRRACAGKKKSNCALQ
jgi:hypothetical protein